MVSSAAYKIIKKACIVRIQNGENAYEVVASYNKLSGGQAEKLLRELEAEGYITSSEEVGEEE